MREREFRDYMKARGLGDEEAESAVKTVLGFEGHLKSMVKSLKSASIGDLKWYIPILMREGRSPLEELLALSGYVRFVKSNDLFVYIVSIVGARNVLPSISERLAAIAGDGVRRRGLLSCCFSRLGSGGFGGYDLLDTPDLAVRQPHLDAVGVVLGPCQDVLHYAPRQLPGPLVLF